MAGYEQRKVKAFIFKGCENLDSLNFELRTVIVPFQIFFRDHCPTRGIKVLVEGKTVCSGLLRVPFPEVVTLSQLGQLGFPYGQGGPPPYNPRTGKFR